jgi:hypothetical protein
MAEMLVPLAPADLLSDQGVGGVRVWDAQQSFGKTHEDDAFLRCQPVFVHERIDAAMASAGGTDGVDQAARCVSDTTALVRCVNRPFYEGAYEPHLVHKVI